MDVLDELAQLFELFHDGGVRDAVEQGGSLRLQLEVSWLQDHLPGQPHFLVVDLVQAARLSVWSLDLCTESVRMHCAVENRAARFAFPVGAPPFTLLLHLVEPVDEGEATAILDRIVTSTCRAVVCWGPAAEAWADDLDHAAVIAELDGRRAASSTLMTSAHVDESLDEVVDFLFASTPREHRGPLHLRVLTTADRWVIGREVRERSRDALAQR